MKQLGKKISKKFYFIHSWSLKRNWSNFLGCEIYLFIDFRGVGGSPSNEEISTDIGSGVNGEKLGTGYRNYLFISKELSY